MWYPCKDNKGYTYKGDDKVAKVIIAKDTCKGCGLCVTVCPKGILQLSKTEINAKGYSPIEVTDMALCIGCASCAKMCPDIVFTIEK
jgi:2-oxoglutarate ferredoxin oxidoreductase subunit delta